MSQPQQNQEEVPLNNENKAPANDAPVVVEVEQEPTYYKNVELGGVRGTEFFTKVFLLITIQYGFSTLTTGVVASTFLPESVKELFTDHWLGLIFGLLLLVIWTACYTLQWLPKQYDTKSAFWWWIVYGVYVFLFGYVAAYLALGNVSDISFLFNLYLLISFGGVYLYCLLSKLKGWYLRVGYLVISVLVFNYVAFTILHFFSLTQSSAIANLASAGSAGIFVILGICYTAVVLEDGFRYKKDEYVYASIVFLVETIIVVFTLFRSLYVEPRKPYISVDQAENERRETEKRVRAERDERERQEKEAAATKKRLEEEAAAAKIKNEVPAPAPAPASN